MSEQLFPEDQTEYRRTWIWAVPLLVFLVFVVGQLLVLLPADALGWVSRETVDKYPTVLFVIVGTFAMVAVLFSAWVKLFERRSMASVGLVFNNRSAGIYAGGYATGLLMGITVVGAIFLAGAYKLETADMSRDLLPITLLMFAFILQSGTEEMIFRGWMMGRIAERYGLRIAVIGNSLLFSLMHVDITGLGSTPAITIVFFAIMTFLFSIFLSLLAIRQRSVLGAAAWHAAWNWIFITWFGLPTTGIDLGLRPLVADLAPVNDATVWLTGGGIGPEGSVITLVVLGIGCVVLLRRHGRV
jgi:membrane protease YdiL (CAAX protease family)